MRDKTRGIEALDSWERVRKRERELGKKRGGRRISVVGSKKKRKREIKRGGLMPRSHQSLNMIKSCLAKHDLNFFFFIKAAY